MKRTGFARKLPPKAPRAPLAPIPRDIAERISYGPVRLSVMPKAKTVQHAGYMDAVRGLPCYRCGRPPRSQFCHADMDKGAGIKSDCRAGWPGCARCHYDIGTARVLPRDERRAWEREAARATRTEIISRGLWPASLPRWSEDI